MTEKAHAFMKHVPNYRDANLANDWNPWGSENRHDSHINLLSVASR
jgi:hypothetical protein